MLRHRLSASVVMLLVALSMTTGCIFIPRETQPHAIDQIGARDSDLPIRVDASTREEVIRFLGPTETRTDDSSRMAYGTVGTDGTVVWPLSKIFKIPNSSYSRTVSRSVELIFDDEGVLREVKRNQRKGDLVKNQYDTAMPWDLLQAQWTRHNKAMWAQYGHLARKPSTQPTPEITPSVAPSGH